MSGSPTHETAPEIKTGELPEGTLPFISYLHFKNTNCALSFGQKRFFSKGFEMSYLQATRQRCPLDKIFDDSCDKGSDRR